MTRFLWGSQSFCGFSQDSRIRSLKAAPRHLSFAETCGRRCSRHRDLGPARPVLAALPGRCRVRLLGFLPLLNPHRSSAARLVFRSLGGLLSNRILGNTRRRAVLPSSQMDENGAAREMWNGVTRFEEKTKRHRLPDGRGSVTHGRAFRTATVREPVPLVFPLAGARLAWPSGGPAHFSTIPHTASVKAWISVGFWTYWQAPKESASLISGSFQDELNTTTGTSREV